MGQLTTSDGQFTKTFTVDQQTGRYFVLSTANKYVNKNIKISLDVSTGSLSTSGTASASISSLAYSYDSTNENFTVTGSGSISGTATSTVGTAGWISSGTTGNITGTASLSGVTVDKISIKASMTGTAKVTPVISKNSNSNVLTGTKVTSKPSSGFYLAVSSAAKSNTITAKPTVLADGYGTTSEGTYTATNSTLSVGANASSVTYFPINTGGISISNTSADMNITSVSYSYNSTNNNFTLSGSGSISGTTTVTITEGYVNSNTSGTTGSYSGTASLSGVTVDKVEVTGALSGTTSALKPSISKQSTPSGVINAADGSATTTAPTSGSTRAYVAVRSAANTGSVTAVPSVTKAGYGTTSYYTGINSSAATVGAAQSDMTYIAIIQGQSQAGTGSISTSIYTTDGANTGKNIYSIVGTKTNTEPNNNEYYLAIQANSSGASNIKSAGWFNTGDLTAKTCSTTDYYPIQAAQLTTSGGALSDEGSTASLSSDGIYNNGSYDTTNKIDITTQTSAANGYYKLTASGYGTVSRGAISKQVTREGYMPADSEIVQQFAGDSLTTATQTQEYFIKQSDLSASSITSSNVDQTITVYAGYYPTNRTITIGKMTTINPTTSLANEGLATYTTAGSSSDYDIKLTPRYSNSAGYVAAHTNTNNGGIAYRKIITTSVTQGTTTVSGTIPNQTATRGTATWGTGWITSGTISAASFANTPTNGVTYTDISYTAQAPILTAQGYLYINKGYTDNLKISLAQLIPNDATITATDQILEGYSAYDKDGNLLVGIVPEKSTSDITQSGNVLTIPWGKYEGTTGQHNASTYTIGTGDYSTNAANTIAGTITPSVAINNSSTYGFTTTQPSGTNGTNYLTINPGGTVTTKWKSTATATITTAGYIATGSKEATVEGTPTITAGTNYYVPIVTPSFTKGTITASISSNTITTTMTTSSTSTSYYIDASASGSASCTSATYSMPAGVVKAVAAGTAAGGAPTAVNNLTKAATRVYIPAAQGSMSLTQGSGTCEYNTTDSENITVSDTNTSGVKIAFNGSGSVTATASTTAGYTPANNSYASSSSSSQTATGFKYITGVTIPPPDTNGDTNVFSITVPNGSRSDNITFVFTVNYDGSVTVAGPD